MEEKTIKALAAEPEFKLVLHEYDVRSGIYQICTPVKDHIGYTKPSYTREVLCLINKAYLMGRVDGKEIAKEQIRTALGVSTR